MGLESSVAPSETFWQQPCLIVDDLKHEPCSGGVALWVGPGTVGYFSNLKITAK